MIGFRKEFIISKVRFAALSILVAVRMCAGNDAASDTTVVHRLPALSSVFPQGSQPGAKLRVQILGDYLDRIKAFVSLDGALQATVVENGFTSLTLDLAVDPSAAYGEHYFRVVSPRGASNVLLFRVGDQPHVLEIEPNSPRQRAMAVKPPVTINARLDRDRDFDFFKFDVNAGETWVFDVRSARNGNSLDAALILLDAEGNQIARSEDYFIWDPFLIQKFEKSGTYYAAVQPTHAHNDPSFAYQLDVRQSPYLETIAPISMMPGAIVEATLYGAALLDSKSTLEFDQPGFRGDVLQARGNNAVVKLSIPADAKIGPHQMTVVGAAGRSNPVKFLVDATPQYKGGDILHWPVAINGTARYRQPERFAMDAAAGQTLVFEVRAHQFGSLTDSMLRVLDAKGKVVASNDDAAPGNKDSYILHTFKEAGRYQIEMRNLTATTGEDFPYELIVRPPNPHVELALGSDQPYVFAGDSGKLKISVVRKDDFKGPVALSVAGLPSGISFDPATVAAGSKEAEFTFHAGALQPGEFSRITVKAPQSPLPVSRSVKITSGGGEGAASAVLDQATLAVVEKSNFSLEPEATTINLVRGGTVEVPVAIRRASEFHSDIRFRFEHLPDGVIAEPVTAQNGSGNVRMRLKASAQAEAGRYARLAILGESDDHRVEQAPRVTLVID